MAPQQRRRTWALTAAVAAAVGLGWTLPPIASAQYRIDNQDGHALDASNRMGSGGYNVAGTPTLNNVTQDNIFLGNVTGFGQFKGDVPYRDFNSFQGNEPAQPSLLLQRAAGGNSPLAAPTYNMPQQFYTSTTAINPPAAFQSTPVGGIYQAAPPDIRQPQDYRLGDINNTPSAGALPAPGSEVGPGAVDMSALQTPSFLTNAPLSGATQLNSSSPNGSAAGSSVVTNTLAQPLSPDDIVRLRGELANSPTPWLAPTQAPLSGAVTPGAVNAQGVPVAAPVFAAAPGGQPIQPQLSGALPLTPTSVSQQAALQPGLLGALPGSFSTGQSRRQYLGGLPPVEQQSPQYAKLRQLLQQYQNAHPQNDEAASRLYEAASRARRQYEQSLGNPVPAVPTPGTSGGASATPAPSPGNRPAPSQGPPPLDVGPIGQAITATGLSQLLRDGEDLARHQQYKDAIAKFLDARQVAPNNMLINVDLANAELGAGFYQQAEAYLRQAFAYDPALLMARYDLKSTLGDDRLQVVISDLKHVASSGDSSATPVLLLAYLSYNSGEGEKAMEYLKLAQSRAGGQDELISALQDHWSAAPSTQPTH